MGDKIKINISCAMGQPGNPKTWSGTPYNFLKELEKAGYLNDAFEPTLNNIFFKILYKAVSFYYRKVNGARLSLGWRLIRNLRATVNLYLTNKSKSAYTLHFGTLGLPFILKPKSQTHYLYTDGSWNLWSQYSADKNNYSHKLISKINKLEKRSYDQVAHIFTTSSYVKEDLINYYKIDPLKLTVVGTGTGIIQPYFGEKNYSNRKILFVAKGRFEDKGGSLVIEAFTKLCNKNTDYYLSIVGQTEYSHINHPNIKTYGFLPINELQELFNTHSLFLMPALNEPWGLVYIEAMLCKMPIVGFNRNSFPELSGNGERGAGIDSVDSAALIQVVETLFSNTKKMESMGNKAQQFALENFEWELTVKKVMAKILSVNN